MGWASRWSLWVGLLVGLAGCGAGGLGGSSLISDTSSSGSTTDSAPGAGIFGRLVDESEQAVAGAEVELQSADGERLVGPVATDSGGDFELPFGDATPPEDAVLVIRPPRKPEIRAGVTVPPGARIEVQVRLDEQGGAAIATLVRPPADGRPIGEGRAPVLVAVGTDGRSAPFQVTVLGPFDPARSDLALAYRTRQDPEWYLAGRPNGREPMTAIPLDLGARAEALHGRQLEVRAIAAPPGRLDGVTSFRRPVDLGRDVALSPEPVPVIVVATRERRLTADGLGPNAVIVPNGTPGVAQMTAADLATLGVTSGANVTLTRGGRTATLRLEASVDPALELATLRLNGEDAQRLGLEPGSGSFAGETIRLVPAD